MRTQPDYLVGLAKSREEADFDGMYRTELPRSLSAFGMLNWMEGEEMYQRHSVGAAVEYLIRMAESVP